MSVSDMGVLCGECGKELKWDKQNEDWICPKCGRISKNGELSNERAISYIEDYPIDLEEKEVNGCEVASPENTG